MSLKKHVRVLAKTCTCFSENTYVFFSKQFLDETSHSILIVRVLGDAVGIGLDRGLGVGHCDSQSGETDHGYIVETVADSDHFLLFYPGSL